MASDEQPQFTCNLINGAIPHQSLPGDGCSVSSLCRRRRLSRRAISGQQDGWAVATIRGRIEDPRDVRAHSFQTPNHPQVGVSWYEAVAYCNWLSERLGYTVRLPSEAEWERAARSTDGRIYPWGDEFDARRCNMSDTGIGATSTVGIFPDGDADCGAADMSGNVWEWCSTKWLGRLQGLRSAGG